MKLFWQMANISKNQTSRLLVVAFGTNGASSGASFGNLLSCFVAVD
jgi:hypothetical protein